MRWSIEGLCVIACCFFSITPLGCDCQGNPGNCGSNGDCPDGQVCSEHQCSAADGGSGWDGGQFVPCNKPEDCQQDELCYNGICIRVTPDPQCQVGKLDDCENDTYCDPQMGGCVPWDAHPSPPPDCEYIPPVGEFTPMEEWVWQNPSEAPEWDEVMMTPVVVDLSGQAGGGDFVVPAVLFNSFRKDLSYTANGVLRAVRGDTGAPIFSVTDPAYYTHPVSNIAVGDIDLDGRPEIVTGKNGGRDLICFKSDGSFKWATNTNEILVSWGGPAIANIDGVGTPEIVMGANVVDANGNLLWHKDQPPCSGDNYRKSAGAPFSVPADVNDDGKMEIVTGCALYDYQGNLLWDKREYGDGFVALADFTGDGRAEILVVSSGSIRLQSSYSGELIWLKTTADLKTRLASLCPADCGLLGPPTVADFDGDTLPEIGVAGSNLYMVLDSWGDVRWAVKSQDGSSNITGSAVFDFEGDGLAEVVYADEVSLMVLRGSDGQVLYRQAHSSLTSCEYPVIADVDGDHNAEIVITQNDLMETAPQKFKGVRVFGDAKDNWVNTRRIWNQHAYYVSNVEENGAIPATPLQNWKVKGLNNFRQNVQGEGLFDAPDLTARGLGVEKGNCVNQGIMLYAAITNRGKLGVPPGIWVSFYHNHPRKGGTLLGSVATTKALAPGVGEVVSIKWQNPPSRVVLQVFVVADDQGGGAQPQGAHNECREDNNVGFFADMECLPET